MQLIRGIFYALNMNILAQEYVAQQHIKLSHQMLCLSRSAPMYFNQVHLYHCAI